MRAIHYLLLACVFLSGCATAGSHSKAVKSDEGDRITVGKVQREIRVGMSAAKVAEILGSPNIVTTDEQRREVWIYDKFATDVSYSSSEGGVWLVIGAVSGTSGAASKTQRTLTIIIKFDEDKQVRDFAYHSSSF
jgi:outer membrane protein assembly factor BamE (lipoprotein component of BamABCDE complex)